MLKKEKKGEKGPYDMKTTERASTQAYSRGVEQRANSDKFQKFVFFFFSFYFLKIFKNSKKSQNLQKNWKNLKKMKNFEKNEKILKIQTKIKLQKRNKQTKTAKQPLKRGQVSPWRKTASRRPHYAPRCTREARRSTTMSKDKSKELAKHSEANAEVHRGAGVSNTTVCEDSEELQAVISGKGLPDTFPRGAGMRGTPLL